MVRQPRPLPPSAPSLPPPPPPTVLAPAAPVAAKAEVPFRNMRQSCFPAELRRVAVAATFGHRRRRRQPQQQVHALERQVPLHGQIRNSDQLQQQQQQRSSSSSSSMAPIALHDANLRSSLMERLRLLENRIFQLSFELDQERNNSSSSSSRGSSSTTTATTTTRTRTRQATTWSSSDKEWPPQSMASSSTGGGDQAAAEMAIVPSASSSSFSQRRFTLGERLQGHLLSKMKKQPAKDSKQVATVAGNMLYCKKEKKRMERTRLYKRWFPLIGC